HLLGECPLVVMAAAPLAKKLRDDFPRSLAGAPFLLPTENTTLRKSLDEWFTAKSLRPDIRGEFADSALMKVFGSGGIGAFAAPTAIEKEVKEQFHVQTVGRLDGI